jgi:hypothetical protein
VCDASPKVQAIKNRDQTSSTQVFAGSKSSCAFDNVSNCVKGKKAFLHKDLAASIEVIS